MHPSFFYAFSSYYFCNHYYLSSTHRIVCLQSTQMKIDTQGMSGPIDPNYKGKPLDQQQRELPSAIIQPRRLFTDSYVKELKILINEVLDAREGKTGVSYFDTEKFKHSIHDQEPPYQEWT